MGWRFPFSQESRTVTDLLGRMLKSAPLRIVHPAVGRHDGRLNEVGQFPNSGLPALGGLAPQAINRSMAGGLAGAVFKFSLMFGQGLLQPFMTAVQDAPYLDKAETETTERHDLTGPTHFLRAVGPPSCLCPGRVTKAALLLDSLGLLQKHMGFKHLGIHKDIGHKLGRWHDIGYWRLGLADGPSPPEEPLQFASFQQSILSKSTLSAGAGSRGLPQSASGALSTDGKSKRD